MVAKYGCVRDFALGERLDNLEQGLRIVSKQKRDMQKRYIRSECLAQYRR